MLLFDAITSLVLISLKVIAVLAIITGVVSLVAVSVLKLFQLAKLATGNMIFTSVDEYLYKASPRLGLNPYLLSRQIKSFFGVKFCYLIPGRFSFRIFNTALISRVNLVKATTLLSQRVKEFK